MEHPEDKIACPHCGQEHEQDTESRASFAADMAEYFTERAFPVIWGDVKEDAKEMSRKEISKLMFYTGATQMLATFIKTMEVAKDKEENNKE